MWRKFTSKKYWLRVAGHFLWFLIIYTIVSWFFRDDDKKFWSLDLLQSRAGFALFMSLIFAYKIHSSSEPVNSDDGLRSEMRWTWRSFFSIFGLILLFSLIIMSVLFGIGWGVMLLVNDVVEPVGNIFWKMLLVTTVMTLFVVLFLFITDKIKRNRKSSS